MFFRLFFCVFDCFFGSRFFSSICSTIVSFCLSNWSRTLGLNIQHSLSCHVFFVFVFAFSCFSINISGVRCAFYFWRIFASFVVTVITGIESYWAKTSAKTQPLLYGSQVRFWASQKLIRWLQKYISRNRQWNWIPILVSLFHSCTFDRHSGFGLCLFQLCFGLHHFPDQIWSISRTFSLTSRQIFRLNVEHI